jgi:Ca2+-binding EF-hand superfamily protein
VQEIKINREFWRIVMRRGLLGLMVALIIFSAVPAFGQVVPRRMKMRKDKVAKAFNRLDLNRDGRITPNEWRRKPKAFDRIDTNHDGAITLDEFRAFRAQRMGR